MAFTAQNFVNGSMPEISANWLNGVDQMVYNVLGGWEGQSVSTVLAALGLTPAGGITAIPVPISEGGTGEATAATALAALGGVSPATINPITSAEAAAGVTPTNYIYPAGDLRRYGAVGGPAGTLPATDDSAAWATAVSTGFVIIPQNYAFKIVTGATYAGTLTILGYGPTSQVFCDSTIITNTGGNGSLFDNFYMGNITPPWLLLRNPSDWGATITTLTQSSTANGYQPTGNDPEYTSEAATWNANYGTAWSTQNIGPVIACSGAASRIVVSRITGNFVRIQIQDAVNSTVQNCNIRGGKGVDGAILFDNLTNGIQTGVGNRAIDNVVRYASNSGISFASNNDFEMSRNFSFLNGESGVKCDSPFGCTFTGSVGGATSGTSAAAITNGVWTFLFADGETRSVTVAGGVNCTWSGVLSSGNIQTAAFFSGPAPFTSGNSQCFRGKIQENRVYENYYDGIDISSTYPPTDTVFSYHQVTSNYSWNNRSTGMDIDGKGNQVDNNYVFFNGTYGIWATGLSLSRVSGNMLMDNNQERNASYADINLSAIIGFNIVHDNYIWGGATQNNYGIYSLNDNYIRNNSGFNSPFFYGLPGQIGSIVENNTDEISGLQTDQSFVLVIQNVAGTLEHCFQSGALTGALGNFSSRVVGGTATLTATPTGADATTAFANGGKISSANTNVFILDTAPQAPVMNIVSATICSNSTGAAQPNVVADMKSIDVNGVTQDYLTLSFADPELDTAYTLNTTNIPAGKYLKIQFIGKLA